jgi:hypothetical protein
MSLILLLKLTLGPGFIAALTIIARRYGPAIAGWVAGLPLSAGPVSFVLSLEQGPRFAAHAAVGSLGTMGAVPLFCLVYAHVAQKRSWLWAFLAATAAGGAAAVSINMLVNASPAPLLFSALLASVSIALMPRFFPRMRGEVRASQPPRHDIAIRMGAAIALMLTVTGVAHLLGPNWTGALTPFPVIATVLAVFAQRGGATPAEGAMQAARLLWGIVLGLGSTVAFFVVLALVLERFGVAGGYLAASAAALTIQAASWRRAIK